MSPITRRRFIKVLATLGAGVLGAHGIRLYARDVEPWQLTIERVVIQSKRIPKEWDGLKIGLLSDLHIGKFIPVEFAAKAARMLQSLKPDLVALTGDFIHHPGYAEATRQALSELRAPLGNYAVFGNHDHWNQVYKLSEALNGNHTLLLNNNQKLSIHGVPLHIVGVDDVWEGRYNFDIALRNVPPDQPAILLAHEPDIADESASRYPFIAQLSGHTHGGQIRIPFHNGDWGVPYGRKYISGAYEINNMKLYVTRGIGMARPTYRFRCPPEVTLLTLKSA
jgi:hypothetical protein